MAGKKQTPQNAVPAKKPSVSAVAKKPAERAMAAAPSAAAGAIVLPQITLTANLQDITGNHAGTTANPAVLRIALAAFGLTLPCIVGNSNIVQTGPEDFYDVGGGISVSLWGNDVINPAGTYYAITVLDGFGNIVQTGAYRFTGTETIDLSSATQITPTPPTPPVAVLAVQYVRAIPTPPQPANTLYTAPGAVIEVYYNGEAQRPGIDWIIFTATQFQLLFPTNEGDFVGVLCTVVANPALDLEFLLCSPEGPQPIDTLYTAPGDVVMVYYGTAAQRPGIDYTMVTPTTFTLNFPIFAGETIYALCSVTS
jgi:hypothetical protein